MNYEAYLKNIKRTKENSNYIPHVSGFSGALELFEETQQLRNTDFNNRTVQSRFSRICYHLKGYRDLYAHSANELEFSLFKQVKVATDNIALYVYTAWILRN